MINYRVIEGNQQDDFPQFDEFCTDFFNPNLYVRDLRRKYGLSRNEYNRLRERLVEKYNVHIKPTKFHPSAEHPEDMTYIHKHNDDKFAVIKLIDGKKVYYGSYDTVDVARRIRDELIENNWDKTKLEDIQKNVLGGNS